MDIMQEQMGGINRKIEILRPRNICKNVKKNTKNKSVFDELISRLDTAEECLWDRWYINRIIKKPKSKDKKRMQKGKIDKNIQGWCFCWYCSVTESCSTLCESMDCSMPGSPLSLSPGVSSNSCSLSCDAIQPSHPVTCLSSCPQSFLALRPFPVLEFQLQHQSFQWIFRIGFL